MKDIEPTPAPTPAPLPTPSPTPSPMPTRPTTPAAPETRAKTRKRKGKQTSRSEQTPPTETPLPVKTHPDEEVTIHPPSGKVWVTGQKHWLAQMTQMKFEAFGDGMTLEDWAWYSPEIGWHSMRFLSGGPESSETYSIEYREERGALRIDREAVRTEDRKEIEKHNGRYLVGPEGQKLQIVLEGRG